jgi:hypothetical protein
MGLQMQCAVPLQSTVETPAEFLKDPLRQGLTTSRFDLLSTPVAINGVIRL